MDYMNIISRSLQNAWKYKFLWLFGLFVGWSGGGSGGSGRVGSDHWHIDPGLLALIIVGALFVGLIVFLLNIWSEGALIHGIRQKESNQPTDFTDCSRRGWKKFGSIFGIKILAFIAVIGVIIASAIFLVPAFLASVVLGILLCLLFVPALIVVIFMIVAVESWALRFAIIRDMSWEASITQGWQLLKSRTSKTIGVALSSFLTKFVFGIMLVFMGLILALPAILIGIASLGLALIPMIAFGVILLLLFTAYLGTFGSSVWTIGFMQLTEEETAPQKA